MGRFGLPAFVCAVQKQMSGAAMHLRDYLFFITFFFQESELKFNRGEFKEARRIFPAVSGLSSSSKPSNC